VRLITLQAHIEVLPLCFVALLRWCTYAGIAPTGVLAFIASQLFGILAAVALSR
jgi:hypothetical protein